MTIDIIIFIDVPINLLVFHKFSNTFHKPIQEEPCDSAIDISNPKRAPSSSNTQNAVELCDSDLQEGSK